MNRGTVRGGPSKGHGCTHVHPVSRHSTCMYTCNQIRSDPNTDSKLGFGCSVSHSRKGRLRGGRTWWCSSPANGRGSAAAGSRAARSCRRNVSALGKSPDAFLLWRAGSSEQDKSFEGGALALALLSSLAPFLFFPPFCRLIPTSPTVLEKRGKEWLHLTMRRIKL